MVMIIIIGGGGGGVTTRKLEMERNFFNLIKVIYFKNTGSIIFT